ncbi:MAG: lysozyme inhibitor LprI family protein [Rhodobacteraceae bacterium]|nr:lysozyme inhibitor LprI family protein [Paracoccaceae bacterium]
MRYIALAAILGMPCALAAQTDPCDAARTQAEMNLCAAESYDAADRELNRVYRIAMDRAAARDTMLDANQTPGTDLLRAAQRGWIAFRDLACAAESTLARGGSMQPLLRDTCMERLTLNRVADLRIFGEID